MSQKPAARIPRALCALAPILLAACGGPATPDLLLLVTVDTLRADRLGAYGSDRELTPNLDALAERALVFDAAYSSASFTVPSLASLMTGRYPEELGIWNNESGLPEDVPTLAGALRERGWRTVAVVSNFVLRAGSGMASGFDLYDDEFPQNEAVRRWPERVARATTDAALSALDACTLGARCFLWVHYQDPHGPYTPPPGRREAHLAREREAPDGRRHLPLLEETQLGGIPRYQQLRGVSEVGFYRAGYHGEIEYTDEQIGRLLEHLRQRELFERAIVVFAADHGEALGEDDYWFAHGEHLTDALVRVPLFLRAPGVAPGRRGDLVSLVDLMPTLLHAATGENLPGPVRGRDLLAPGAATRGGAAYLANLGAGQVQRYGLAEGEHKLIVSEDGASRLFHRDAQGGERPDPSPEIAAAMRRRLDLLRASLDRSRAPAQRELTDAERAALKALGYAD